MPVAHVTINDHKDATPHKKIIVFNIDLSGSMSQSGMRGVLTESKISVAITAMKRALKQIPDGTEIEGEPLDHDISIQIQEYYASNQEYLFQDSHYPTRLEMPLENR